MVDQPKGCRRCQLLAIGLEVSMWFKPTRFVRPKPRLENKFPPLISPHFRKRKSRTWPVGMNAAKQMIKGFVLGRSRSDPRRPVS